MEEERGERGEEAEEEASVVWLLHVLNSDAPRPPWLLPSPPLPAPTPDTQTPTTLPPCRLSPSVTQPTTKTQPPLPPLNYNSIVCQTVQLPFALFRYAMIKDLFSLSLSQQKPKKDVLCSAEAFACMKSSTEDHFLLSRQQGNSL